MVDLCPKIQILTSPPVAGEPMGTRHLVKIAIVSSFTNMDYVESKQDQCLGKQKKIFVLVTWQQHQNYRR